MAKREFLQLAHTYKPEKHGIAGHWTSNKLDGQRCFWDGGVSRGILKKNVPWANTAKDARYKIQPIATGLWSRYGNVIHAPDAWLDELPRCFLDGELWSTNLSYRQEISSIIKQLSPNANDWQQIDYFVFDSPNLSIFGEGFIKGTNFTRHISLQDCKNFVSSTTPLLWMAEPFTTFRTTYFKLGEILSESSVAKRHVQVELDFNTSIALKQLQYRLDLITEKGGEGIIVRDPNAVWVPERSHKMLKVKPLDDAEATVIGYTSGKLTDLGSKHLGYVGALIIDFRGSKMELAGLNDEERILEDDSGNRGDAHEWAKDHPGQEIPWRFHSILIPRKTVITLKFRGLSKTGIPQEARYWRKREDV